MSTASPSRDRLFDLAGDHLDGSRRLCEQLEDLDPGRARQRLADLGEA